MSTTKNTLAAHGVPSARFWTFENNSWVKLTLEPGQSLTWGKSARDEEGFSAEGNTWSHDGDRVLLQWSRSGRDCDGYVSEAGELQCSIAELASVPVLIGDGAEVVDRPDWQKVGPVEETADRYSDGSLVEDDPWDDGHPRH